MGSRQDSHRKVYFAKAEKAASSEASASLCHITNAKSASCVKKKCACNSREDLTKHMTCHDIAGMPSLPNKHAPPVIGKTSPSV